MKNIIFCLLFLCLFLSSCDNVVPVVQKNPTPVAPVVQENVTSQPTALPVSPKDISVDTKIVDRDNSVQNLPKLIANKDYSEVKSDNVKVSAKKIDDRHTEITITSSANSTAKEVVLKIKRPQTTQPVVKKTKIDKKKSVQSPNLELTILVSWCVIFGIVILWYCFMDQINSVLSKISIFLAEIFTKLWNKIKKFFVNLWHKIFSPKNIS